MATVNWRTINVDLLDPESSANFSTSTLVPAVAPVSASEVQTLSGQIRQLLRAGDTEGALRGSLENVPYGGETAAKDVHLATVIEILQSIKQSDMSPLLTRIYGSDGGIETLDVLMKYLYETLAHQKTFLPVHISSQSSLIQALLVDRYKGMSHTSQPAVTPQGMSPQSTGYSQISSRAGGEGGGQAMSVLLSWHEKLIEVVGAGSIVRVMTDRRTV